MEIMFRLNMGINLKVFTYQAGIVGEYAHMKDPPLVSNGQFVTAGTQLGLVGSTGKSTGEHLHYSVYTKPGKSYAANVMANIFGAGYMGSAMTNNTNTKTVYDPLGFVNKYKSKY